ncbi:uncharacterized [Tachysurus ichikawai]
MSQLQDPRTPRTTRFHHLLYHPPLCAKAGSAQVAWSVPCRAVPRLRLRRSCCIGRIVLTGWPSKLDDWLAGRGASSGFSKLQKETVLKRMRGGKNAKLDCVQAEQTVQSVQLSHTDSPVC